MQITKQFVTAGNAKFTISNPIGMTYEYQIKKTDRRAQAAGLLLVYSFDRGRRIYVGRLDARRGIVTIGRRSRITESSMIYQVIRWACTVLWLGTEFPADYKAETLGRCGRCGRRLSDPNQLFGPECQPNFQTLSRARRPTLREILA